MEKPTGRNISREGEMFSSEPVFCVKWWTQHFRSRCLRAPLSSWDHGFSGPSRSGQNFQYLLLTFGISVAGSLLMASEGYKRR